MSKMDEALNNATTREDTKTVWGTSIDLPTDKLATPYLRLAQATTPEVTEGKARMGQWLLPSYPPADSVVIVPVGFAISRRYAIQNDKNEFETICYSPGGREHGIGNPGIPCSECMLKDWTGSIDETTGKKTSQKPLCAEAYEFLSWSETHKSPVIVVFRSSSLAAGGQLATLCKVRGMGQFPVRLESARQSFKGFTFSKPAIELIPESEWSTALSNARMVMSLSSGTTEDIEPDMEELS